MNQSACAWTMNVRSAIQPVIIVAGTDTELSGQTGTLTMPSMVRMTVKCRNAPAVTDLDSRRIARSGDAVAARLLDENGKQ